MTSTKVGSVSVTVASPAVTVPVCGLYDQVPGSSVRVTVPAAKEPLTK